MPQIIDPIMIWHCICPSTISSGH